MSTRHTADGRRNARCEHGITGECEQCAWRQDIADDQANDDDWMFDPRWEPSDGN